MSSAVCLRQEARPDRVDQIRTVDRERLLRRLGAVSEAEIDSTLALLREMFEA
jgi:mRNA-degrading endonuclease toxin of MazEF toxin-antitoxin module